MVGGKGSAEDHMFVVQGQRGVSDAVVGVREGRRGEGVRMCAFWEGRCSGLLMCVVCRRIGVSAW